jgi:ketosteroid isomerase-like protein
VITPIKQLTSGLPVVLPQPHEVIFRDLSQAPPPTVKSSLYLGLAAQSKPDSASSKIIALENKWNAAYKRGDIATMESLLADDFIITVEDGSTFSKSGYIARNGDSTVHVEITEMSGMNVRMHGNAAVVTGAYHEKGVSKGKPYDYHDRFTDMWMNINGKWRVVASHYSIPTS